MASVKSPRPTPKFFQEPQTFSTKKERVTPRYKLPPRPPVKSAPPASRLGLTASQVRGAQPVSFCASESSILSKCYDEKRSELYFHQCFEILGKIGAGSFGEVYKVRNKEDKKLYAVKRSRDRFRGELDRARKLEEVAKHEELPKHRNCVKFFRAWEENQRLYIQTELCELSLSTYAEHNHDITETLIWNYLVDLLLAVKHLHDHNLAHMDIKPANIFISKDGICKLGDFGLVLDLSKRDLSEALEGDPKYLAPELMQGKFTKAADVFSLGITILELACDLDLPQGGDVWHQLRQWKLPLHLTKCSSSSLVHVIQLMMTPDYRIRPSVDTVLNLHSVKKVWRKRKRELWMKATVQRIRDAYSFVFSCFTAFWTLFSKPFAGWTPANFLSFRRKPYHPAVTSRSISAAGTSRRQRQNQSASWDCSFSDDEYFGNDLTNGSQGPLTFSLDDASFCSNGSYLSNEDHEKQKSSTPATDRQLRTPNRFYTPGSNHSMDWDSYRRSPNASPIRPNQSDESEEFRHMTIGPKNLMEIFEAESDED